MKPRHARHQHASTLVIVLWVALGLVALGLYFGQSSSLNLRAADHRAAALEADQAIQGAARYAAFVVTNLDTPGLLPPVQRRPTLPFPCPRRPRRRRLLLVHRTRL